MTTDQVRKGLPAGIRRLCARLATERTRREAWDLAAQLRRKASQRLEAGIDPNQIEADLLADLREAVAAQQR